MVGIHLIYNILARISLGYTSLNIKNCYIPRRHLKDLLQDDERTKALTLEAEGLYLDLARQNATPETLKLLLALAEKADVKGKIDAMYSGEHINTTEDRAVLHVALRAKRDQVIEDQGVNTVAEVYEVLDKIQAFSGRLTDERIYCSGHC